MKEFEISRRGVLQLPAAGILGAALLSAAEIAEAAPRGKRPQNIIYMVADGMSMGVPSLTEQFAQLVRGIGTNWYALLKTPHAAHGLMETHSLNTLVTDSAAASSSWGSGSRVFNGMINTLPDKTKLTPIAHLARDAKRKIGLVTTCTVTHATPAGFAAVESARGDEALIALQYLDLVDVVLGGGTEFFDPTLRKDKRDLYSEFAAKGYAVAKTKAELSVPSNGRILGIFSKSHVPYTLDHRNTPELTRDVPTLAEMTQTALETLSKNRHGFLLQVEGGRVDHAAHANDAAGILWDQLAFDDALGVALAFATKHRDTLIVVTSDHCNANPGLNGMGTAYKDSSKHFGRVADATMSFEEMGKRIGKTPTAVQVREIVEAGTRIPITPTEAALVARIAAGSKSDELNRQLNGLPGTLGAILSNHNGIGWTGTTHTADLTSVTALGAGSERFSGLIRNTDVFTHLTQLMGINFQNPTMTPAAAQKYLTALRSETRPHWA